MLPFHTLGTVGWSLPVEVMTGSLALPFPPSDLT